MTPRRLGVLATHPIHYQVDLVRRLAQVKGLDVEVLFCSRFGLSRQVDHTFKKSVQWYDESILEGYTHRFLDNYSLERSPRSPLGTINPGILRELASRRYDAFLVQGYAGVTEWLAMAAAKRNLCRILFRGETVWPPRSPWNHLFLQKPLMRLLSKRVDVFLPIGSRSRDFYLRHGIPAHRLVLSPYAVDNDSLFREAAQLRERRREIRTSLGIPSDLPIILYAAKMIPRKRPLDLLRAFEALSGRAALAFAGDGPLKTEAQRQAGKRNLRQVWFFGFRRREELFPFYAIADLFVLPSEYEPWGLGVNEAMCFSLPIVTTEGVSSSADLVFHGENGWLYPAGDIPSLQKGLLTLLEDGPRRSTMGRRSSEIVRGWGLNSAAEGIVRGMEIALGE